MDRVVNWWIHGDVDWELYRRKAHQLGPLVAGMLFAAGWWVWADALVVRDVAGEGGYPFKLNVPGAVATLGLLWLNLLPRGQLQALADGGSGDDGELLRARMWLAAGLAVAFGAVGGSIAVLLATAGGAMQAVGVASVVQCGLVLAAALLLWALRSDDGDSGSSSYYAI